MAKIVTITIDEDGNADVDLAGFQGKGCGAIQEAFSLAMGSATEVIKKPEFNKPCLTTTKLTQGR